MLVAPATVSQRSIASNLRANEAPIAGPGDRCVPHDRSCFAARCLLRSLLLSFALTALASAPVSLGQSHSPGAGCSPAHSPPTPPALSGVISGIVLDSSDRPIGGAAVSLEPCGLSTRTGAEGSFSFPAIAFAMQPTLHVEAATFALANLPVTTLEPLRIVLTPASASESVVVTAYRAPLLQDESPASTRILSQTELRQSAGTALDDKLRQVPGFELFRRSSSLVANPTSQGISLRGLGSTAASRTLVVSGEVPLNDPFGGWIHWDELPELSIQSVDIVRGGASDLYGSSAIGGVIEVVPVVPQTTTFQLLSSYGSFNTFDDALLGSLNKGRWSALLTGGILRTDGYTLVAPQFRGPVDVPSNVDAKNGRLEIDRGLQNRDGTDRGRLFILGNVLSEARSNGTPATSNGTRLWRYEAGADVNNIHGGAFLLRLFGGDEHFRQTFSSVAPGRITETQTRYAETPAVLLGGAVRWTQTVNPTLVLLGGADTNDVRGSDREQAFLASPANRVTNLSARQRQTGVYAEALWMPENWTISGSGRIDHFVNFDAQQFLPVSKQFPNLNETVLDPRLGILRHINSVLALTATGFRAYRAPTENELYRTGQVGQQTTLPNPALRSERATGWEVGTVLQTLRPQAVLRTSYFWTRVDRPITALTQTVTPTSITKQRENLGRIESRGLALDGEMHPWPWLTAIGGYQLAIATVTQFTPDPTLVGKWIPQVARNTGALQLRAETPRLGVFSVEGRISGHQFDDDANAFLLRSFFAWNVYAAHTFHHRYQVFASGENLLDRSIQVGRTPVLTLGTPRAGKVGIDIRLPELR